MGSFSFDLSAFEMSLKGHDRGVKLNSIETNRVPYDGNKNKFVKMAFDMFKSKYDNTLWELAEEEGSRYLIKRTDLDDPGIKTEASDQFRSNDGSWVVACDQKKPVVLSFGSVPIKEFDPKKFNYDNQTKNLFAEHILEQIKTSPNIAKKYVNAMNNENKYALIKQCEDRLMDDEARLIYSWLKDA